MPKKSQGKDSRQGQDGLSRLERALGSLEPAAPAIDRDELLFQAGYAAAESATGRPVVWPWRVATLVSSSAAVVLLALTLFEGPGTDPIQEPVFAESGPQPSPTTTSPAPSLEVPPAVAPPRLVTGSVGRPDNYLSLRRSVVSSEESPRRDYRAPRSDETDDQPASAPATSRRLMQELLGPDRNEPLPRPNSNDRAPRP